MNEVINSLSPGQVAMLLMGFVLAAAGAVNTIGSAWEKILKAWRSAKAPDEAQNERITKLEKKSLETEKKISGLEEDLRKLSEHHETDMDESRDERQLIVYGVLCCLKGLQEQGCDGTVSGAIEKFEKHLNAKAHQR